MSSYLPRLLVDRLLLAIGMTFTSTPQAHKPSTMVQPVCFLIARLFSSITQHTINCEHIITDFKSFSARTNQILFDTTTIKPVMRVHRQPLVLRVSSLYIRHDVISEKRLHRYFSGSSTGPSVSYSFDLPNSVPYGSSSTTTPALKLTFDTNSNTYSTSSG